MCGRFSLRLSAAALQAAYPQYALPTVLEPRYNIAPSQPVLLLQNTNPPQATHSLWGLLPSWSKDPGMGARLINARAETLAEKPSFRGAYQYRRGLLFADGFYEWQAQPGTKNKTPYFIHLQGNLPFTFAALWETWQSPDGSTVHTFALITTAPNALMETIHPRMPVILPVDAHAQWLDPRPQKASALQALLRPYPAEEMSAFPVSSLVNNPANDQPSLTPPLPRDEQTRLL